MTPVDDLVEGFWPYIGCIILGLMFMWVVVAL